MTHDEIEELLGAYALDAVERDEADEVERHLAGCPRCRAEVAGHREVAAALAHAGADAPEGLWARIAGSLEETPPAGGMPAPLDLGAARAKRAEAQASVPRRALTGLVAAAAVAVVVIGLLSAQVVRQGDRIDQLASAVEERGVNGAAASAALAPDARRVALRAADGRLLVSAVVGPKGEGYLVADGLPTLDEARTYQLWALVDGQAVSVGVLGTDPAVVAFRAPPSAHALALTEERAGGAPAPTQAPFASGAVPATA
ncbi:MAG TPA: anti-sigma factor [Acidimicrobiales bacterium]|nr:anti-sigma factor [Acidimicrobiales bacterium]